MSVIYNPRVQTSNLIGCYDPSNAKSYPGSGTTVTDLRGIMGNGTMSGFSVTSNFFYNGSSATTSGITVPLTNFSKVAGSIDIWAKPDTWVDSNGLFINRSDNTANAVDWLWIGAYGSGSAFYFRLGNGSTCCSNDNYVGSWSSTHPTGVWGHYVCTWESPGTSYFYFNGNLMNSLSISGVPNTNPSSTGMIGNGHSSTNSAWRGYIGPVKFYNKQLSASEVKDNFNAYRLRFGI